ncbi:MAG: hypothetical protein ABEJ26_03915 [Halosimplex sp.]
MSSAGDVELEFDVSRVELAAFAVATAVLAIVALPTTQSLLYGLFFGTPSVLQWGAVAAVIAAVGRARDAPLLYVLAVAVFVVLGLLVGPVVSGVYAHSRVADELQSDATNLQTLPNTSAEHVRALPRSVADNYAQSSMQYPQYRLTESDIAYRNGSYAWSYGVVPDNFLVALLGNQHGALYVDMTTTDKRVDVEETEFATGRGQLVTDGYRYRSVLATPFKRHDWDTTFNARANGTAYIAHSTTVYEWHFRAAPIPQLYAVPRHGSVEVMHTDGSIESLSPREARESPLLRGQNFYPYGLAMFDVESMQYVHGALNKWFWKEDVLAIADLPESGNEWPIVVPTEGAGPELTYFVATEPTGTGNGVYEVWTVDGQSGAVGVQRYSESQIGPQKAVEFVERRPQVNRLSNAEAIAPAPVVRGDTLYWHVKVVSGSRSGVVYTAFVNAESGDVTLVEGTEPIYAFLRWSELDQVPEPGKGQSGTTVTVVVTNADGEIVDTRNVTVPAGGGVQVEVQDNQPTNATAAGSG